ncbi:DUF2975 domain-containing protein [Azospirillum soli]|uniref:DUF2975 domain-containing protein n=1 Tax=Azospirillum soli TaxID=1304799 RepID=UPI001AEBA5A7|nr:DUF2975 domain-containing protein [Azospirillum soli]MBP2310941.1 hypothetical protein [Azospirillum soli]
MTAPDTGSDNAAIARISGRVAWILTLALLALPPGIVAYVQLFPHQIVTWGWVAIAGFEPAPFPPLTAVAVIAVLLAYSAPIFWGLWELRRLFQGFAIGEVFTVAAAKRLRRCGIALMVLATAGPAASIGLSTALSMGRPPGVRKLVVGIGGDDVGFALIGVAILVIAQVMVEATRIAQENAEFV